MGSQAEYEEEVWGVISKVVEEEGLVLFDLDLPSSRSRSASAARQDSPSSLANKEAHTDDDSSATADDDRPVGVGVFRVIITRSKDSAATVSSLEGGDTPGELSEIGEGGEELADDSSNPEAPRRIGVSLDQCARVARRLLDIDEQKPFVPDGCELEVSSPGINRRLRRPEHFATAVGERVKVKFRNEKGGTQVVTGIVTSFEGDILHVAGEGASGEVSMPLANIKEARVDFRFG